MPEPEETGRLVATPKIDFSKVIDKSVLKDQSCLVTGGASGIGQMYVETLAEAGAYVTFIDVQEEKGQEIAKSLTASGHKVQFVHGDVRSWDDQVKAFEAAIDFSPFKALDIVLLVAGITAQSILDWVKKSSSQDGPPVRPDTKCIDINLTGCWYGTHLALHYFRRSLVTETRSVPSKQLVLVSSLAGYIGCPYHSDYGAAKFGVRGIWHTIRDVENLLGEDTKIGFRSSLVAPWFVDTAMTKRLGPLAEKAGVKFAGREECVDVMLRIVCDEQVKSRAVAIAMNGRSFDLCDDVEDFSGGRELCQHLANGAFGSSALETKRFFASMSNAGYQNGATPEL